MREPEYRLWLACLNQLLLDAERHRQGRKAIAGSREDAEIAHWELMGCGPHLRWICAHLDGYSALDLSRRYRLKYTRGQTNDAA